MPAQFYQKNVIFIHVPKNAGTSISFALYGQSHPHRNALFYKALDPEFYRKTTSFALLREPIDRTISSYLFFKNKGGSQICLSKLWEFKGRHVDSFDNYLNWLDDLFQSNSILDFTMRSQSEFVSDHDGKVMTTYLFRLHEDKQRLLSFLSSFGIGALPTMNVSKRSEITISSRQRSMIERLYAADFELFDSCH